MMSPMTVLQPEARPVARILALLPVLLVIWLTDSMLPRWAGVADAAALTGGWAQAHRLMSAMWWLVLGLFLFLALEGIIWRALQNRRIAVPKLMVDLVRALVFVVGVFGAISALFDQTLTGLLATSGIVAIVLGFALQSTLADLFSGIALNLERPFRVGDWVKLDDMVGQIVQTNWRATHLRTLDGNDVVVPNSKMAGAELTNFNLPAKKLRQSIQIPLPADIAPARVQCILVASALRCERVLNDPMPRALVKEFQDGKIVFELEYWIDSYAGEREIRSEIGTELWRALDVAGISLIWLGDKPTTAPSPSRDKRVAEARRVAVLKHLAETRSTGVAADIERLLKRVDLFRHLDPEHRAAIIERMVRFDIAEGKTVVEQGEQSDWLFIVGEGLLDVTIAANGSRKSLGRLCAAQVFGEMSLLTGAPRSATVTAVLPSVVYAISKADFETVLRENEQLAADLAAILEQRRANTDAALKSLAVGGNVVELAPQRDDMFERMKHFFGLS
jgi:small-conductance mechanosensitive channel/CRP-like cAMP-binding protein